MNYIPLSKRSKSNYQQGSSVDDIMNSIKKLESSGNYQARGPVVESGMYAGERALGAFQIMPGNLPAWSKEALGREVTEEEFLSNPEIQDSITRHQMQKNYEKYGNADDVASVWFSGRPVSQAGNASDVTGTDVPEYIRRFRSGLGQPQSSNGLAYIPLSQRRNTL